MFLNFSRNKNLFSNSYSIFTLLNPCEKKLIINVWITLFSVADWSIMQLCLTSLTYASIDVAPVKGMFLKQWWRRDKIPDEGFLMTVRLIRPSKKICVFTVTRPTLFFSPNLFYRQLFDPNSKYMAVFHFLKSTSNDVSDVCFNWRRTR
jgi:hypothetical protein